MQESLAAYYHWKLTGDCAICGLFGLVLEEIINDSAGKAVTANCKVAPQRPASVPCPIVWKTRKASAYPLSKTVVLCFQI